MIIDLSWWVSDSVSTVFRDKFPHKSLILIVLVHCFENIYDMPWFWVLPLALNPIMLLFGLPLVFYLNMILNILDGVVNSFGVPAF